MKTGSCEVATLESKDTEPINQVLPLSFIVLTYNEERNLAACLESVSGWAGEVLVVDSGSTDRTVEIAALYGAKVVVHGFESHAKQWTWALRNLRISNEWVLALDADQRLTPELRKEIAALVGGNDPMNEALAGCFIKRRQVFRGRWIKHGGYYPKYMLKLFRLDRVSVDDYDLVDHHFRVRGKTTKLKHDIVENNQNEADISVWIDKHNRYAALQAQEELIRLRTAQTEEGHLRGNPDERILFLKRIWGKLPLYIRPGLYFLYRYVIRLGFLDGKEGFIFHFLQAFWYRLLVDIKIDELRRADIRDANQPEL